MHSQPGIKNIKRDEKRVTAIFILCLVVGWSGAQAARSPSRQTCNKPSWAFYPVPERNWIKSGMWKFGSTESGRYYHTFSCPDLRRISAKLLLGWDSASKAIAMGYEPHPKCHAPDPRADTSLGARVRDLFNQSQRLYDKANALAEEKNIVAASQYMTNAWIAYGDALMLAANMEKRAGRMSNANELFRHAAAAYVSSHTAMPPIPAFGGIPGTFPAGPCAPPPPEQRTATVRTSGASPAPSVCAPPPRATSDGFVGSVLSKKFHRPTCSRAPRPENSVAFATEDEAIKAGYQPCSYCY